jgi:hypothetical protein
MSGRKTGPPDRNIGTTDTHVLFVELKEPAAGP